MNFLSLSPLSEIIAHTFRSHRLQEIGEIPQQATRLPALGFRRRRRRVRMLDTLAKIFFELAIAIKNTINSHVCRNFNKQSKFNKSADNLKRPLKVLFNLRQMCISLIFRQKKSKPKV